MTILWHLSAHGGAWLHYLPLIAGWQIGPKIRVGGTLGKIGQTIKEHLPSPGGIIGAATGNPILQYAGSKASGANPADDLKKGAALTPLALAGTHALGNGGTTGTTDTGGISSPKGDPIPGTEGAGGSSGSVIDGLPAAIKAGGSALVKYLTDHKDEVGSLVSAYAQYQRQQQAAAYAKEGLDLTKSEYNDPNGKGALRLAGTSGMLNPNAKTPDLSSLQSLAGPNSGNPFTKALPLAPLNHGTPGSMPGTSTPAPSPLPLTGIPNPPSLAPGQQTGTPPTIPVGMKPPPGWTPPKALPLATDPNAPRVT